MYIIQKCGNSMELQANLKAKNKLSEMLKLMEKFRICIVVD